MSHSNYLSDRRQRPAQNDMTFNSAQQEQRVMGGSVTETDQIYSRIKQQRADQREREIERIKA